MINPESSVQSTRLDESVCMGFSITMHLILFLLNPAILKSDFKPAHDFVTVDVVDQPTPGGYTQPETPKKTGLMATLKDMLMKPKTEEIAHIAPNEPIVPRVAAPIQPALKDATRPRPMTFEPHSQTEDLAASNAPNTINTARNVPSLPIGQPALTSKSFSGGIKPRDLPFSVSHEGISGGDNVIPIAVGNRSAKDSLAYGGPTLKDVKDKRVGIQAVGIGSAAGNLNALGGGGPETIALSGTGGTGNAPTGATSGNVLQDRAGSGTGFGRGHGFGSGSGRGSGFGSGIEGMPSAAQDLDRQIGAGGGSSKSGKLVKKGFEIAGPLNNRTIVHKIIPQYPAWAEEQGIIGSVRLYFTVTPEGMVRPNIRVTKTTGYPQLDQLGIDALKQWQFAPLTSSDADQGQWGIITFNFSLSS